MNCRICGTDNQVEYRRGSRMKLCAPCAKGTPRNAGRAAFDKAYWGSDAHEVSESIKKEFYSDYKTSSCTVREYIDDTTYFIG